MSERYEPECSHMIAKVIGQTRPALFGYLVVALAVLTLTGCAGGTVQVKSPAGTEVKVGQKFTVTLSSNRTTGYGWQLAMPLDEAVVKLVGSEYEAPVTQKVGAGGQEVWTFRATGPGKAEISLSYVRPWEKDLPPANAKTYTVTVK